MKLQYFYTVAAQRAPGPNFGICSSVRCMCVRHDFSNTNMYSAVCLSLFIYSGTAAKGAVCIHFSEACTQTENDLNLESLLNHQNTPKSLGVFLTCNILIRVYMES